MSRRKAREKKSSLDLHAADFDLDWDGSDLGQRGNAKKRTPAAPTAVTRAAGEQPDPGTESTET